MLACHLSSILICGRLQDKRQMLELICNSFGYSPVLKRNGAAINSALQASSEDAWSDTEQPIRNMVKDMSIVQQALC